MMTRNEIFKRMREHGWEWDGVDDEDPDGMFTKPEHVAMPIDMAAEFLLGFQNAGDELRG
jgi:hypothetical protein